MLLLSTRDFLKISEVWDEKTIEKQIWAVFPNDFFFFLSPVHNNLFKKGLVRLKVTVIIQLPALKMKDRAVTEIRHGFRMF